MERGKLYINENGVKFIPVNGNVWLSEWQIADLFGVTTSKISSNIRSLFKSAILQENKVSYCYRYTNGNWVDLYNLDMITALSYRIHSRNANIFRSWLMKRVYNKQSSVMQRLTDERKISLN
jgi:hypothetical protein